MVEVQPPNPTDGDATFNLLADRGYTQLMNEVNRKEGGLHVEIVPADQIGCRKGQRIKGVAEGLGTCSGLDVAVPHVGEHVRVVGAYVFDAPNGWYEIHPVWKITRLPRR